MLTAAVRARIARVDVIEPAVDASTDPLDPSAHPGSEAASAPDPCEFDVERGPDLTNVAQHEALATPEGADEGAAAALAAIRARLADYGNALADEIAARGESEIAALEQLIDAWLSKYASFGWAGRVAAALAAVQQRSLATERRKLGRMRGIERHHGVRFNTRAGLEAARDRYAAGHEVEAVKRAMLHADFRGLSDFTLGELDLIDQELTRYGSLASNRPPSSLTTISSAGLSLDDPIDTGIRTRWDSGEYFDDAGNVSFYATARNDDKKFGMTVAHELSHALVENLQADTLASFMQASGFWASKDTPKYGGDYPAAMRQNAANVQGCEAPPTKYGTKNAAEDLADSMALFCRDPKLLEKKCPKRFAWISQSVAPLMDPNSAARTPT